MHHKHSGKHKGMFWLLIIIGISCVAFIAYIAIRLVNIDQNLDIVFEYKIPDFSDISDLKNLSDSRYAIAVDGNIVYANNEDIYPTASTAKMILGLAIIEKKPFQLGETGESIKITQEYYKLFRWYSSNNGSHTRVNIDEEISEYDALASVFLSSSNNMADTLAIWAFGSLEAYREYATEMLQRLGATHTTIGDDASGYRDNTTSTTTDLAMIGANVLENPVLAEIVGLTERDVPVAGTLKNTNQLLGKNNIIGVKTGFINEKSGYCLITGYRADSHIITVALTGAATREKSFEDSLTIVQKAQEILTESEIIASNKVIGYYDSWWGRAPIKTTNSAKNIIWQGETNMTNLDMHDGQGILTIKIGSQTYEIKVEAEGYKKEPDFTEKVKHVFGWKNN